MVDVAEVAGVFAVSGKTLTNSVSAFAEETVGDVLSSVVVSVVFFDFVICVGLFRMTVVASFGEARNSGGDLLGVGGFGSRIINMDFGFDATECIMVDAKSRFRSAKKTKVIVAASMVDSDCCQGERGK